MCKNGTATAVDLMKGIEPTLTNILSSSGVAGTPAGQTVETEFNAALEAVQNWKHGTPAQDVMQVVQDFEKGFGALPISPDYKVLADIVAGGLAGVLAILEGNSPAPAAAEGEGAHEETQAHHVAVVASGAFARIQSLVPGFKPKVFTGAGKQYKDTWNNAVDKGGFPSALKVG